MEVTSAEIVGTVNVIIYQTSDGDNFFEVQGDNKDLFPILDVIEDSLVKL